MQALDLQNNKNTFEVINEATATRPDYSEPAVAVISPAPIGSEEKKPFIKPPLIRSNAKRNLFDK
jgi:hypothetical protein